MDSDLKRKPEKIISQIYSLFPALIIRAAIRLNIFTYLNDCTRTAKSLCVLLNAKEEQLSTFLLSLEAIGVLEQHNGKFRNTPESRVYLGCKENRYRDYIIYLINKILSAMEATEQSTLIGTPRLKLHLPSSTKTSDPEIRVSHFSGSLQAGRELARKIDLSSSKRILDVAGVTGGVSCWNL